MIEWTLPGVIFWIIGRLELLIFYSVLGLYFFEKHKNIFQNTAKNLFYSVAFISLVVGVWEMPLFIFGVESGWIWILNLILYIIPFPVICAIFHIRFTFSKTEILYFVFWCTLAINFVNINNYLYFDYIPTETGHFLWNYDISYVFRVVTFICFYLILRKVRIGEKIS